jgi:hypothetical protein
MKKKYYEANKEAISERRKEKYASDPELRKRIAHKNRENYLKNPDIYRKANRKYKSKKRRTDPIYNLNNNISKAIRRGLKYKRPGAHWEEFMPFSLDSLITHIESLFESGMCWENYGEWHIDHIIPLSWFNYNSVGDEEFKRAWSLNNLQPKWAFDNQSKSNKYIG